MLIRNTVGLPAVVQPGVDYSLKGVLRLGIVFIGIKLSLLDILTIGAWGIPIVAVSIATGLVLITWLNQRLHLPERLGTLIAAGTGICGITAIVSIAPTIRDRKSTRLNSSHVAISYAVFCLKKKIK